MNPLTYHTLIGWGQYALSSVQSCTKTGSVLFKMVLSKSRSITSTLTHKQVTVGLCGSIGACITAYFLYRYTKRVGEDSQESAPTKRSHPLLQIPTPEALKKIACATLGVIAEGSYTDAQGNRHPLRSGAELLQESRLVEPRSIDPSRSPRSKEPSCTVICGDCLDVAQNYVNQGFRTAVLLFASPVEPGGGFTEGTNGQEERICYRSEMAGFFNECLTDVSGNGFYASPHWCNFSQLLQGMRSQNVFHPGALIHTPQVQVFRASEQKGYAFLPNPFTIGVLSSPAPVNPKLDATQTHYASPEGLSSLETTLCTQLEAAFQEGYDVLILGAFGCGAFKNPPHLVATTYRKLITNKRIPVPAHIVFAILEDPHLAHSNLSPFQELFV